MQEGGIMKFKRNKVDKQVILKKGLIRAHVHRSTLRFKTRKAKEEEEGYHLTQDTLQKFLDVVLKADPKTTIPPYLDLDRADKAVPDLSNLFTASSVDSYYALKNYFFCLSPRDKAGISWCSIILAKNIPFQEVMDKMQRALENQDFTRVQDKERLTQLLSQLINENVGVKWK
jgi:hypothetical protein